MNFRVKQAVYPFYSLINVILKPLKISYYIRGGRKPFGVGYKEYKWNKISELINDQKFLDLVKAKNLPDFIGKSIDERIIEYPWIFSNLSASKGTILDAGSTFNYKYILEHPLLQNKELTIYTYFPELYRAPGKRNIKYVYGDLRNIPFLEKSFDLIVCQSTLEHIDMDNSTYGYDISHNKVTELKSYEYLKVIHELERILKKGSTLLLTFPFGKFENHGFFQQFDGEMVGKMIDYLEKFGIVETDFMKYTSTGWRFSSRIECANCESYNPQTGKGRGADDAAHSRSVCLLKFIKN